MAMYEFRDVGDRVADVALPSEALNYNGKYFEVEVPGYRTLYTKGRESMNGEFLSSALSGHGSAYQKRRYPEREITVGFLLRADTPEDFRNAFNKLNALLNTEQGRLIFNDEPDKFFVGTPVSIGEIPPGVNHVTSEILFVCADPFKYSVREFEREVPMGSSADVYYNGTYPAHPSIVTEFEADTAYASYSLNDSILLFGSDDADEEESSGTTTKLLGISSDQASPMADATLNGAATVCNDSIYAQTGFFEVKTDCYGDKTLIRARTYGTSENWHGPSLTWNLGENCTNFRFKANLWMHYRDNGDYDYSDIGVIKVLVSDSTGANVCGTILKEGSRSDWRGQRMEIIRGTTLPEEICKPSTIICARGVTYPSQNMRDANAIDVSTNFSFTIEKIGDTIRFAYPTISGGRLERTYQAEEYAGLSARSVTIYICTKADYSPLYYMGIRQLNFWHLPNDSEEAEKQIFYAGDVAAVDTRSGRITVNDVSTPAMGAIDNAWEGFVLKTGKNTFTASQAQGSAVLRFREVFL